MHPLITDQLVTVHRAGAHGAARHGRLVRFAHADRPRRGGLRFGVAVQSGALTVYGLNGESGLLADGGHRAEWVDR
jgi:hypothetical protein